MISRIWGDEDQAPFPDGFGEFQYTYSKGRDRISLLEVKGLNWNWESYCLDGFLFDDIEKFDSMEEAEPRIKQLLNK